MSVFLVVAVIVLSLLGADIRLTAVVKVNANNEYCFKAYFFGISVYRAVISYHAIDFPNRILWLKINGKLKKAVLSLDENFTDSIGYYMASPVVRAIDFKYADVFFSVWLNDMFASVMLAQSVRLACGLLSGAIRSMQEFTMHGDFSVREGKKGVKFELHGVLSITIANIAFGFVRALINKYNNHKEIKIDTEKRRKTA